MTNSSELPMSIPISLLNAYAYCPRRFYYEFTLAEMVVNEHVLEGQQLHERVDLPGSGGRDAKVQFRRIYLCAPRLGIHGYGDLLEAEDGRGEDPAVLARAQRLYPVEYKKGRMGKWVSDHTQLCAQALALEEALSLPMGSITHGFMFYIQSAHRDEIALDEELRQRTKMLIVAARHAAILSQPPEPISNWQKCRDCSLEPLCLPREVIKIKKQSMTKGVEDDSVFD